MRLSVIVPIFNKGILACKCLRLNAIHAKEPIEWILIDNHSDQETVDLLIELTAELEQMGHQVIMKREPKNTGVAVAWNSGLRLANNESICILNNDAVMQPNWVYAAFEVWNKGLDFFTPLVVEPQMVGKNYSLECFLGTDLSIPKYRGQNWVSIQNRNKAKLRSGYFGGVIIFGKRIAFNQLGGFDEQFWLSLEDMDFLIRAEVNNFKVGTTGYFTAFHYSGATRNTLSVKFEENQKAFEKKWGWNFEKNEHQWPNRWIRSWQKKLWAFTGTFSEWPCNYPKTPPLNQ